jgi:hypothetical protein
MKNGEMFGACSTHERMTNAYCWKTSSRKTPELTVDVRILLKWIFEK